MGVQAREVANPLNPIRVVCDHNYPPYCFRSDSGAIQGIIPDQWAEWSRRTGRAVEFLGMDWADCLAAMRDGRADVIDSIFRTKERELSFDFLPPYADLKVPVFFHESISGISMPEDLKGFRVAVKAGDACIDVLREHGITSLIEYSDYASIVAAAGRKEVRIFCVDEAPALYYLYKYDLEGEFKSALTLYTGQFHRAVLKNRPPLEDGSDLLAVLRSGFASIPKSTYRDIDRRWFGSKLPQKLDPSALLLGISLGIALVAALVAFSATLKIQVARKTRALIQKTEALEASEKRNRLFIEALPDLFILRDRQGRYIECKTSHPELLVRPAEEMLGKTGFELGVDNALVERQNAAALEALDGTGVVVFEYDLEVQAGRKHFETRMVKLAEDRVLSIIRDLTGKHEAERKLVESLRQKEILLKEVHHRVKNNMQVISSLIQLQAGTLVLEEDRKFLEEMQHRVRIMAQLHELLYRSEDLGSIDMAEYVRAIALELRGAYAMRSVPAELELELESLSCTIDTAMPLGLFVNEVVSNSLKYGGPSPISILLQRRAEDGKVRLFLRDRGPGLPAGWETRLGDTLGLTLIGALAQQLSGALSIRTEKGTQVELVF